ncbi:ATP-dependent DNA helicase RecQ-like [Argopecten irradians]|uniref:ATP-dependent DNA helicase RecQ-like n=1 Tax=Argopecten irradians TaxID=31199 RepID=UPI0037124778
MAAHITVNNMADGSRQLEDALNVYNNTFNTDIKMLKTLQIETILNIESRDVIATLPTGYGKSLTYEILPLLWKLKHNINTLIIVIVPLNVVMDQQTSKLGTSAIGLTKALATCCNKEFVENLKTGNYQYMFSHPENILNNANLNKLLIENNQRKVIVVDEVHCMLDWGHDFRPDFKRIVNLRSVLPSARVLALSATLSTKAQQDVAKLLLMKSLHIVQCSPARDNISLIVCKRPSSKQNITVKDTYDYALKPMFQQLKVMKDEYPLTIIYFGGNINWVGHAYEVATFILKDDICDEFGSARVVMYHSAMEGSTNTLKEKVHASLKDSKSVLKIILATVALGMGVDLRNVRQIINIGPPNTIEAYVQQIGRAGRDGEPSAAILYYNGSDLAHVTNTMKEYCKGEECRRKTIIQYFMPNSQESESGLPSICCDKFILKKNCCTNH